MRLTTAVILFAIPVQAEASLIVRAKIADLLGVITKFLPVITNVAFIGLSRTRRFSPTSIRAISAQIH